MDSANALNTSLPSFIELMASLGLQDEHSVHALLRGASLESEEAYNGNPAGDLSQKDQHLHEHDDDDEQPQNQPNYRNSTASAASLELPTPTLVDTPNSVALSTPLSSASLLTPLNSPPAQRERPSSHGHLNNLKKRYSPYGLSAPVINESRDIYTRRGSVPGTITELQDIDKRQLHHQSAPTAAAVNYQRFSQPSLERRLTTDTDGDEEMHDAAASLMSLPNRSQPAIIARSGNDNYATQSQTSHCAGQPNLLMTSRQRNPRNVLGPRTKSQSHLRTTVSGITETLANDNNVPVPPLPSSSVSTTNRKNSSPYNSVGRRSGRTISTSSISTNNTATTGANGSFLDIGLDNERDVGNNAPVVSISSYLRRSQPAPLPSSTGIETVPESPTAAATASSSVSRSHHLSLPKVGRHISGLSTPPSAPPTKTTFGFGPGGMSMSNGSVGPSRRARHARSSSARSVRDMIREREPLVPIAPLHSFHPFGEDLALPSLSSIKRPSISRGESSDGVLTNSSTTSLPLDDSSRSFSQRRRIKRPNKRNSPPPPLMLLPTLPHNFSIKAIVGSTANNGASESNEDRLGAPDGGYVSRRDPHSPDARATWRTRRTTPPTPAPIRAMPMTVMES